jgi:membrane protein involved in colicin uptake
MYINKFKKLAIYSSFILHKVLININIVSNKFQEKNATLGESKNIIEGVMMTFKNSRTEYFSKLWCEI